MSTFHQLLATTKSKKSVANDFSLQSCYRLLKFQNLVNMIKRNNLLLLTA